MSFHSRLDRLLPIAAQLKGYERSAFIGDLGASLAVAAVSIPQSMGFAMLAGFEPAYGLYTAIVAGFVGSFVGRSPHLNISLSIALCLMVGSVLGSLSRQYGAGFDAVQAAAALALLMGVFQILIAVARLAELSRFVSYSVLLGFQLGVACLIAGNQLGNFLGIPVQSGSHLLSGLEEVFRNLPALDPRALAMGAAAIGAMVLAPRLSRVLPGAFVAVIGTGLAVLLLGLADSGLPLVSEVPSSLPTPRLPQVNSRLLSDLVPGAMALTILGAIDVVAVTTGLAYRTGESPDIARQIGGKGLANIACGLAGCLPCSSSYSRSFLSLESGAVTQLSGILCSLWILLAVLLAGPFVSFVPKACLAGVLIVVACRIPYWSHVHLALKATRSDAAAVLVTFVATVLLRLDTALLLGVMLSVALFLRKAHRPHLVEYAMEESRRFRQISDPEQRSHPGICVLHVEGELFFGAAQVFETEVSHVAKDESVKVLLLRLKNARNMDATGVIALRRIAERLRARDKHLLVSGIDEQMLSLLERTGVAEVIGRENIFISAQSILQSTSEALKAAVKLVGKEGAEVRVFYDRPERVEQLKAGDQAVRRTIDERRSKP